ncbi:MAG: DNA adenine methylase [Chloroflexota bacterium]|nr:DNA adenine methylase [Chloroflexota bacterium]
MKKPFSWYGGKGALAPFLVSLLPLHQVYCEVFGGSGALLFAKEPSDLEVFNDLDSGVVNFFRVLRNPQQAAELQRLLTLTPYAREEYYDCLIQWEEAPDPVEKARQWYVGVMQSMNSSIRNTGWSTTKAPGSNPARAWVNTIASLTTYADRLAHVEIDHRDFEAVIHTYDSPVTCFYLDPPYLAETRRKGRCYHQEMGREDHERLLSCILQVQGMVILSGYAHPLYQEAEALASWESIKLNTRCSSAVRAHAAQHEVSPEVWTRTECIWMNPACVQHQRSLFHALQGNDRTSVDSEISQDGEEQQETSHHTSLSVEALSWAS